MMKREEEKDSNSFDKTQDLKVTDPKGDFLYSILFRDSFEDLAKEIRAIGCQDSLHPTKTIKSIKYSKILIVTDSNVAPCLLGDLEKALKPLEISFDHIILPAGEEYKNLDSIQKIYEKLIKGHYDRHALLLALGGGVIGDMTGFAASTYLRGVDFIQIPTTLLSQVDSSVGGKTGVDFMSYKNMIGAFYMPKLVYMNDKVYQTLPKEQLISGLGEVVKYGFICDRSFLDLLNQLHDRILSRDKEALRCIVRASCNYKKQVVEEDPKEEGLRAILNFGHTIGHAIEKQMDFTLFHGDCVGLGMVSSLSISRKRGLISEAEEKQGVELIRSFGLPVKLSDRIASSSQSKEDCTAKALQVSWPSPEEVLAATRSDKKRDHGKIRFILLHGIGNAVIETNVSDDELLQAIRLILR